MNEFIDAHAHLIWPSLQERADIVLDKASRVGVHFVINCGVQIEDFLPCVALSQKYSMVKNIIGLHPGFSINPANNLASFIEQFQKFKSFFIGIGEIGLDFLELKDQSCRKKSEEIFRGMLSFASEMQLPVVIHCRNAEKQAIKILEEDQFSSIPGVLMHCFGGAEKFILESLDHQNWYFTIPTSIIFKKIHQNLAKRVPIERMMLETDCPFLSPIPDEEINEPKNVIIAAEEVVKIKDISLEEVAGATSRNCRTFFNF